MIVATEVKASTQIKPRKGQGRAGLRRKVKNCTPPQLNTPTQVTNKPVLQNCKSTTQPQTSLETGPRTSYIPVPQTRSGQQPKPRLTGKELPPYPNPVH